MGSKKWLREVKADVEKLKYIHPAKWKEWDWANAPETIDRILEILEVQRAQFENAREAYQLADEVAYSDDHLKKAKKFLYGTTTYGGKSETHFPLS